MTTVFNINNTSPSPKLFFDEQGTVGVQRYDRINYPKLEKLYKQQRSFFWIPEEIAIAKDSFDFKEMTEAEQHIFTSNIKRQIVLDSVQGRAPSLCFGPIVSNPTMEKVINIWTFFETIHSESYTYIIKNVYPDPSKIFDEMTTIKEIVSCGTDVSKYYDDLLAALQKYKYGSYEQKKASYLALVAANVLEQIRFQVSFACTFNFGQRNVMEGSSRIVKLIRQDEAIHCGFTQQVLKIIVEEDEVFAKIECDCKNEVEFIHNEVLKQEIEWIDFLFSKGPIIGLTKEELKAYLIWLTARRMKKFDITHSLEAPTKDPLPWMAKWLNSDDDQPPPQEEELTSYQQGTIDFSVESGAFDDFEL
jgi:ribonucleoside-diphosphate reductase beta chain